MKKILLIGMVFILSLTVAFAGKEDTSKKDSIRPALKGELPWLQKAIHNANWALSVEKMIGPRGVIPMGKAPTVLLTAGSAAADLPYIGQMVAPNLSKNTVEVNFNNPYKNYQVTNLKKDYMVTFSVDEIGEKYKVKLIISPNGYTTMTVSSNARSDMRYMGNLHNIPNPKMK